MVINHGGFESQSHQMFFSYKMQSSGDWILCFYKLIRLKSESAQSAKSAHWLISQPIHFWNKVTLFYGFVCNLILFFPIRKLSTSIINVPLNFKRRFYGCHFEDARFRWIMIRSTNEIVIFGWHKGKGKT